MCKLKPIHPSIQKSIHPSIHPFTYPSKHLAQLNALARSSACDEESEIEYPISCMCTCTTFPSVPSPLLSFPHMHPSPQYCSQCRKLCVTPSTTACDNKVTNVFIIHAAYAKSAKKGRKGMGEYDAANYKID
mmetsp:Transcript_39639/g.64288  ORF Transcript_39639/g.64288 Transcript_39639/m.64288 type:complete len:132 (+) Transcript_39639:107-502(+)